MMHETTSGRAAVVRARSISARKPLRVRGALWTAICLTFLSFAAFVFVSAALAESWTWMVLGVALVITLASWYVHSVWYSAWTHGELADRPRRAHR